MEYTYIIAKWRVSISAAQNRSRWNPMVRSSRLPPILDLATTQRVKNVLIVPEGAKAALHQIPFATALANDEPMSCTNQSGPVGRHGQRSQRNSCATPRRVVHENDPIWWWLQTKERPISDTANDVTAMDLAR